MENQFIQPCDVASKGLRLANLILDIIFINLLAGAVWFVIGFFIGFFIAMLGVADAVAPVFQKMLLSLPTRLAIACFNMFFYFFLCEVLWQRTLAKLITGTKVVAADGARPRAGAVAARTLCRLVPFECLSFLTSSPGGWHDWWSGTVVVRTAAALNRMPQPASYATDNAGFLPRRPGTPAWEPTVQSASVPEPPRPAVTASEPASSSAATSEAAWTAGATCRMPRAQRSWLDQNMKWIAIGGPIVVVLGVLMVWSANRPVPSSASAADAFDQTEPVSTPSSARPVFVRPSAPPVSVPASELANPFSSPATEAPASPTAPSAPAPTSKLSNPFSAFVRQGPVPVPAPKRASSPAGLPPTLQVDAVVAIDGKFVAYTDIGELSEGQTVSGWKVARVTTREIVLEKGDVVHTYPLSASGAN